MQKKVITPLPVFRNDLLSQTDQNHPSKNKTLSSLPAPLVTRQVVSRMV